MRAMKSDEIIVGVRPNMMRAMKSDDEHRERRHTMRSMRSMRSPNHNEYAVSGRIAYALVESHDENR
jgi:hypothetical protein